MNGALIIKCSLPITDSDDDKAMKYKFGIYGLKNKTELLQTGDPVRFQVDTSKRAVNILALRTKSRATVESMKGEYRCEPAYELVGLEMLE